MKDPIVMVAEIACEQHRRGEISLDELVEILQRCINATAQCNGYAEKLGLPFPEVRL